MRLVNIYNHKRQIYLFCRDDKGNLIIDNDDSFFPYFYEKDIDGKFKSIDGQSVKKVFVSEPSNVPKARTDNSYEADILFVKRYMIDRVKRLDKCPVKYAFIDIEVLADELPNVKEAIYPISCISVYNSFNNTIQTWYLGHLQNEEELLRRFIQYMKEEKFDLWLSWNVSFDYNYLFNRIESMKNYFNKKSFPELISPIGKLRYGDGDVFYPAGISIIDYLGWDKKVTLNRRKSYALDNVAQKELKDKPNEKIEFGKLNPKIEEKNINDIERMIKLEEKLKYIDYFDEIRRLTKVEWEDMIWNSRIIDMLLLQEAKDKKIPLPMKPSEDRGTLIEKEKIEGAYRDIHEKGLFENVAKYDIKGCYPNIIKYFCLDSANVNLQKTKDTIKIDIHDKEGNYLRTYWYKQDASVLLPSVANKLLILKDKIKKEKENINYNSPSYKNVKKKYDAIKTITNSLYGTALLRFFRLYNKPVAETITFLVRDLLHYIEDEIKKEGYNVVYLDTDGLMIANNTKDISDLFNKLAQEWAIKKYKKENISIEVVYEGYFTKVLLLTKCRYKGWLKTDKGIKVEIKGIEAKRKDSTIYMKKFQTELIDKIFNKEIKKDIFNWIKDQIKQPPNQQLKDIAFPCRLAKKPEDYKNVPIFVRALKNTSGFKKKVGNNFYYIFVKPDEERKIKTIIKVKDTKDITYRDIELDENLSRKEGIEYVRKQFNEPELDSSRISVLHQKERAKDVMAFDEDNYEHIKRDMVDWDMIIKRNIIMKLDTIFEAMGWDVKEIGYQPTPKLPKIKAKSPQIKPKTTKPIERPQEPEKNSKTTKIEEVKPYYEE